MNARQTDVDSDVTVETRIEEIRGTLEVDRYSSNSLEDEYSQNQSGRSDQMEEGEDNVTQSFAVALIINSETSELTGVNLPHASLHDRVTDDEITVYSTSTEELDYDTDSQINVDMNNRQQFYYSHKKAMLLYVLSSLLSSLFNPDLFFISITALLFGPLPVFSLGLVAICLNMIESLVLINEVSWESHGVEQNAISARFSKHGVCFYKNGAALAASAKTAQLENINPVEFMTDAAWNTVPSSDRTLRSTVRTRIFFKIMGPLFAITKFIFYMSTARELLELLFSSDYTMLKELACLGWPYFRKDAFTAMNSTVTANNSTAVLIKQYPATGSVRSFLLQTVLGLFSLILPFTICTMSENHIYSMVLALIGSCCSAGSLGLILLSNIEKTERANTLSNALMTYTLRIMNMPCYRRVIFVICLCSFITGLLYNHRCCFGLNRYLGMLQKSRLFRIDDQYLRENINRMVEAPAPQNLEEDGSACSIDDGEKPHGSCATESGVTVETDEALEGNDLSNKPLAIGWSVSYGWIRFKMQLDKIKSWSFNNRAALLYAGIQLVNLGVGSSLALRHGYVPPPAWRHLSWAGAIAQGLLALDAVQRAAQCFMSLVATVKHSRDCPFLTKRHMFAMAYLYILLLTIIPISANSLMINFLELFIGMLLVPLFMLFAMPLYSSSRYVSTFLSTISILISLMVTAFFTWFIFYPQVRPFNNTLPNIAKDAV